MCDILTTDLGQKLDEELDLLVVIHATQVVSWNVKPLQGEPFSTSLAANSQCRRGLELSYTVGKVLKSSHERFFCGVCIVYSFS